MIVRPDAATGAGPRGMPGMMGRPVAKLDGLGQGARGAYLPARQSAGTAVASLVARKRNIMLEYMRNQREIDSD